jgi:hypothetical protein
MDWGIPVVCCQNQYFLDRGRERETSLELEVICVLSSESFLFAWYFVYCLGMIQGHDTRKFQKWQTKYERSKVRQEALS